MAGNAAIGVERGWFRPYKPSVHVQVSCTYMADASILCEGTPVAVLPSPPATGPLPLNPPESTPKPSVGLFLLDNTSGVSAGAMWGGVGGGSLKRTGSMAPMA